MIAIITARSGSKRIPGKNIRNFNGKPIIAYSIELALQSGLFDEVMVSTDSKEIRDIALEFGATVPFLRSKENSSDFAGTADVIKEVILEFQKINRFYESGCCIYPTAPLLSLGILRQAFEMFKKRDYNTVFPVVEYSYPIQRSLFVHSSGNILMKWPENYFKRSQDLEKAYHDAGQFYFFRTEYIIEECRLFSENSGAIIISELEAQDIDNEIDWKIAEFKFMALSQSEMHN